MSPVLTDPLLLETLAPQHGPIRVAMDTLDGTPLILRDLVLYPDGPDQTAIELIWPDDRESCINTTVILENVHTVPGHGFFWREHITLVNAWNARLIGCNTIGPAGMSDPVSLNGITLEGKSTGVTIAHHRASGLATAVWIKGACEGTKIEDLDAIGVVNGVVAWPDTGGGEPGLWISNSHINATQWGIHLRHRYQVFLRDCLIYGGDYFATTQGHPFYGLVAEDCQELICSGVKVGRAGDVAAAKPIVPYVYTRVEQAHGIPERVQW